MIPLESIPADVVCFPIKFLAEEIWLGILSVHDASYHQIILRIASHSTRRGIAIKCVIHCHFWGRNDREIYCVVFPPDVLTTH
jgi:hypothetical protein